MKWLRDVVSAHYYFDPLAAVLSDIAVILFAVFCVAFGLYLAR